MAVETALHDWLSTVARPDLSAGELFTAATAAIASAGYENLDFGGNVGHSIARRLQDRVFLERGAATPLGDLGLFTFEPHIRKRDTGHWGFKQENIYTFDAAGTLIEV